MTFLPVRFVWPHFQNVPNKMVTQSSTWHPSAAVVTCFHEIGDCHAKLFKTVFAFLLATNYYRVGCFKDTNNRAMPKLLGNWRFDSKPVQKCSQAAEKAGYSAFGVQYAGECWSGPQAHMTFSKYGASSGCLKGTGASWAQDVYIFSKWCFGDVTFTSFQRCTVWGWSEFNKSLKNISIIFMTRNKNNVAVKTLM